MEDVRCKARLVAGGHGTKAPSTLTYASVVSQETVGIALLIAVLKDIDERVADVLNAFINAPCHEKIWTTLSKEFGDDCGRKAIVVRACMVSSQVVLPLGRTWQGACARWAICLAQLTLTCGSKSKHT
eukprot:CCRYP_015432-RA/>CCRYP_015432-RA protein AED:0.31 eAED:0.33 QI:0/-1/0/1/-1/1/1/0/127